MGKSKSSTKDLQSSSATATASPSSSSSSHSTSSASIQLSNGFLAVPITIPTSNKQLAKDVKHWIYVRKHTTAANAVASSSKLNNHSNKGSSSEELPAERTLFIANLPIDATESHLRDIFGKCGATISTVKFRKNVAVKEEVDEEDEREQKGEGEVSSDEEDTEEDEEGGGGQEEHLVHHQGGASGKKGKKAQRQQQGKNKTSRVPRVIPLPSLDPREAMGSQSFLSTSSSAHVVFLDVPSFTRGFEMMVKSGGVKWTDPFKALRREVEKQQEALLAESTTHPTQAASKSQQQRGAAAANTSASFLLKAGGGAIPPLGLEFLLSQYALSRPSLPSIQTWANSRISLYQYRKSHPLPRKIGVRGVTVGPSGELLDEDGFIIVQRSSSSGAGNKYGRVGAAADAGGSVGIAKHGFEENKKKKSTGLEDFYRFQLREKKREQLADLRAKFEADKQKVAKLKAGRRFKPY